MKKQSLILLEAPHEHSFFKILPKDWQQVITPVWKRYQTSSNIYVFKNEDEVIAGGIIFSECPPDMVMHSKEAHKWLNKGYLYIGFLFVAEHMRHQKLGSQWIEALKEMLPQQNFWLVIEEEDLGIFYERHQFMLEKILESDNAKEWLYTYRPPHF